MKHARSFNLEVICREKAWGSFVRRYGQYVREGKPLPSLVEFTLKDDKRGDPLITEDALVALDIVSKEIVDYMKDTEMCIRDSSRCRSATGAVPRVCEKMSRLS